MVAVLEARISRISQSGEMVYTLASKANVRKGHESSSLSFGTMQIEIDLSFFYKIKWFFQDLCSDCGGTISKHINDKYYCDICDKRN